MATVEERGDGRTVQLKNVRLVFTDSLKEARATVENGEPKHTCTILLEADKPESEANKKKLMAALEAASEREWKKKDSWKAIAEDDPKRVAFRKGERFKNKEGEVYAGFAGNHALAVSGPMGGKKRPKILNRHKQAVAVDDILDVVYPGTYADVVVSLYGTNKGGKGVFASVEAIRSRQEGERVGGGVDVDADDFDDLDDDDDLIEGESDDDLL